MRSAIKLPDSAILEDQTLRDGLQGEDGILSVGEKIRLVQKLISVGVRRIQLTAFVNPSRVPQMADAEELFYRVRNLNLSAEFSALVLNKKGLERAIRAGCSRVEVSVSASNTHGIKNTGMELKEALKELNVMIHEAKREGLMVRGGVQCAFGCRFEGEIALSGVIGIVRRALDGGADEIVLADTTGMAHPVAVQERCSAVMEILNGYGSRPLFLHLHDTEGKGLANVFAALQIGVTGFDATVGGLGGCPFIPGAMGNIAMEDLILMLHQMSVNTGIDLEGVIKIGKHISKLLRRELSSRTHGLYCL